MKELLSGGIKYLKSKSVDYGDIRWAKNRHESISVKNLLVENISDSSSEGLSVRVLKKNSWGFASCAETTQTALKQIIDTACLIADSASEINRQKVNLSPVEPVKASYKSNYIINPFDVALTKKIDYLLWACHELKEHPAISTALSGLDFYSAHKLFFSTEGSEIEQEFVESSGFVEAIATLFNEVQIRTYPLPRGDAAMKGFEFVKAINLVAGAKKTRDEAVALLRAKECPTKKTALILDPSQLILQIHESCGHAVELDRVFGNEISYAGGTFMGLDKLGKFKYGSKIVNINADSTYDGAVGTFGYDDEGTPAKKVNLIENGRFVNYLSSRQSAAQIGRHSSGSMRASSWNSTPLIRMTNINLEPGKDSLDSIIRSTKDGILMSNNKSWSIDDTRLNFQFGAEIAWEIKNGKIGQILKNPLYAGITPKFWRSCSAIADKNSFKMHGILNCGKGEPAQEMHVGHGASPAKFENVQISNSRKIKHAR